MRRRHNDDELDDVNDDDEMMDDDDDKNDRNDDDVIGDEVRTNFYDDLRTYQKLDHFSYLKNGLAFFGTVVIKWC